MTCPHCGCETDVSHGKPFYPQCLNALRAKVEERERTLKLTEERAEKAEALLALATYFQLPEGWTVEYDPSAPEGSPWGLFARWGWFDSYPTRDEAFAAWWKRKAGD